MTEKPKAEQTRPQTPTTYGTNPRCGTLDPNIEVVRNDALTVAEVAARAPSHIVLSPGPGRPRDAGVCEDVVAALAGKVPILGVCLGHQAICEVFGATVSHAKELMHGKPSDIVVDTDCPVFRGLPSSRLTSGIRTPWSQSAIIQGARYHSLSVVEETIPETLRITARAADGEVMGVRHAQYAVYGVQFHPESILTPDGSKMLANFLEVS